MSVGTAYIFGASGGLGKALCKALAERHPDWIIYAGYRSAIPDLPSSCRPFWFDLRDEQSIQSAAQAVGADRQLNLVIVATGVLQTDQVLVEKSARAIDPEAMAQVFAINTIGPALIAKHFLPLLRGPERAVFAAISARVGSIQDNRLGGWHSYRASKAALNMLVRNFAIELGRTNPNAIAVALHPGTVDTPLSQPFQRNVPDGKLFTPCKAANSLLAVIDNLKPEDSGKQIAWNGDLILA